MKKDEAFRLGFHPFRFFFGYKVLACEDSELPELINLCRRLSVNYRSVREKESGQSALCVPFFYAAKIIRAAKGRINSLRVAKSGGLPYLLFENRFRLGVPLGVLCVILAIFLSQNVIWDVRVGGNDKISKEEIVELLDKCGLSVGTKKSGLSTLKIENHALILSDDLAWINVNIIGCVAEVTVKEIDFIIKEEPKYDASNLVSTANGIIVGFEEIKGNIGVKIGDSVSKGQLLVGGIYGDEENGFRYTNADGRVLAETERVFEDRISRIFLKKRYTGRQKSEKYLIFFKKEVKFFGNCRNLYGNYDKIEVEEYLPSMGEHDLPVGIRTVTYLEYEYTEETRTDNELLSVAKYKQSADIERTLKDAELLSKKESFVIDKDGITLTTKVKTIENIAKRQEIEIDFF